VDLGGADGLVHVSELSYNRVNHPNEILRVGQEVDVMVLSVDRDTKKIALSLKRAMPDPWDTVEQDYHIGQVVQATITKLAKFGAFAKVQEGLEGLIHLSELTDRPVTDPSQVVQEGQVLPAKIIHINSQRRRLGLSARQAQEPQYYGGSYGDFDDTASFAPELASYAETNFGEEQPASAVANYEEPTDSQDSPDVESEPQAQDESPTGDGAVPSEDTSPVAEEDQSQAEDQAPEVASATSQASDQH
jgi:small subunit ribosomal protein S1